MPERKDCGYWVGVYSGLPYIYIYMCMYVYAIIEAAGRNAKHPSRATTSGNIQTQLGCLRKRGVGGGAPLPNPNQVAASSTEIVPIAFSDSATSCITGGFGRVWG